MTIRWEPKYKQNTSPALVRDRGGGGREKGGEGYRDDKIFSGVIDLWTVAITLYSLNDLTLFFRTGLEGRGLKLACQRTTAASSPWLVHTLLKIFPFDKTVGLYSMHIKCNE